MTGTKFGRLTLVDTTIRKFSNLVPGICLTTIHSAKGSEYESVIITGVEEIDDSENEQRVLYVGVTRAKKNIYLLYTQHENAASKYIETIKQKAIHKDWNYVSLIE
jgi:superfamily I DNA/RNA helicase